MKTAQIAIVLGLGLILAGTAHAQTSAAPPPSADEPVAIVPDEPPPPPPDEAGPAEEPAPPQVRPETPERPEPSETPEIAPVAGDPALFQTALSPYGRWVDQASYGRVWVPRVAPDWRPYTVGRWAYTDDGWTWDSAEPWGWATYHYGRWLYDRELGWAWVPGTLWAPAWVAWAAGGDYIGWAPLPPAIGFSLAAGLGLGAARLSVAISPTHYTFVDERAILAPRIAAVVVSPSHNAVLIRRSTRFTSCAVFEHRIVARGIDVRHVERAIGRPVPRLRLAAVTTRSAVGRAGIPGQLAVYRPPALATAARATRAEFGREIHRQLAAQRPGRLHDPAGRHDPGRNDDRLHNDHPRPYDPAGRGGAPRPGYDPSSAGGGRRRTQGGTPRSRTPDDARPRSWQPSPSHPHRTPPAGSQRPQPSPYRQPSRQRPSHPQPQKAQPPSHPRSEKPHHQDRRPPASR